MRLKVLLPTEVLLDVEAASVVAEGPQGYFALLPRHRDWVSALVPGILTYRGNGGEHLVAVDEGLLVKTGEEVLVSVRRGVLGGDLGSLERTVEESFLTLDDRERGARTALAKLEAGVVRRFLELSQHG